MSCMGRRLELVLLWYLVGISVKRHQYEGVPKNREIGFDLAGSQALTLG